jgi:hypothetical protein
MSETDLFTAEGDSLLDLILSGNLRQTLLCTTPNWTEDGVSDFSKKLQDLFKHINDLPGNNQLDHINHRYLIQAKLDCLKAASKVDDRLFKTFNVSIGTSIETFSTDFKRHWLRLHSLPRHAFMKLWRYQERQDLQRQSE